MRRFLIIIILGLLWSGNTNAYESGKSFKCKKPEYSFKFLDTKPPMVEYRNKNYLYSKQTIKDYKNTDIYVWYEAKINLKKLDKGHMIAYIFIDKDNELILEKAPLNGSEQQSVVNMSKNKKGYNLFNLKAKIHKEKKTQKKSEVLGSVNCS
tara:strand:- start:681 stop:1136 length:456 start_codon:yes stop_codon:yes gene_type:complete